MMIEPIEIHNYIMNQQVRKHAQLILLLYRNYDVGLEDYKRHFKKELLVFDILPGTCVSQNENTESATPDALFTVAVATFET